MRSIARLLLVLLALAPAAWATLGQYEGSVSLDQQVLRGEMRDQVYAAYKVHQIISSDGAVIREYVSPQGKVFGISWHAHVLPNLSQLLGSYFPRIQQAAQARTQRRAPLLINAPDLVYCSGGRMMNFHGSAYLPSLLPRNVAPGVVR